MASATNTGDGVVKMMIYSDEQLIGQFQRKRSDFDGRLRTDPSFDLNRLAEVDRLCSTKPVSDHILKLKKVIWLCGDRTKNFIDTK